MRYYLLIILGFFSLATFGQDLSRIEKDLLIHLKKINYWADYTGSEDSVSSSDSLQNENDIFSDELLSYTSKQPLTLTYDFKELQKEHLTIAASADKKFRIYSWDTWTGGTMHAFSSVYQYQSGGKVFSKTIPNTDEDDPGGWFSQIFTLTTPSKTIYLGYLNEIYSTKDDYQAVKFFSIDNNQLNDTLHLLKTKKGMQNKLGFGFDFFSVVNRKERPVKLIYFDDATKTIKIPVINDKNKVTDKFIVYQFNGQYFERVSN